MSADEIRPPHGVFADRGQRPTDAGIRRVLAAAREAWDDLEAHLVEAYGLERSLHFMYGEKYGWALRFQKRGGRLFAAMYPNRGRLTLQVILPPTQIAAAVAMGVPAVAAAVEAAKPYPEGRWLFVPVTSLAGARELRPLLALKNAALAAGAGSRRGQKSKSLAAR